VGEMNKITRKRINIKRKENINKKLALQVIFSIILVAAVIVTKNIDSEASRKFLDAADQKITQSLNLKEVKSTIGEVALGIKSMIPFINSKGSDFAAPVSGKIYKDYGINKGTDANYYNHGLDIISNTQSVKSISSGKVVQLGNNEKLSDYVVVESEGKTIIYGQIKESFVAEGERVAAGDIIAALNEENMMLHLEVWEDGESVNPTKLFDIDN
jgi:murein DD-endopeptidase MepM/ murein hydrolase activator NlpD